MDGGMNNQGQHLGSHDSTGCTTAFVPEEVQRIRQLWQFATWIFVQMLLSPFFLP